MPARLIALADCATTPWRNGLGTTREIARATAADGSLLWMLGRTAITRDCPFSDYAGFARIFTPIAGDGVVLTVDGAAPVRLDRLDEPFAFSGDAVVTCRLIDGAVEVVNAMAARTWGAQQVALYRQPSLSLAVTAPIMLLHALRGALTVAWGDQRHDLAADDTLRLDALAGTALAIALAAGTTLYAAAFTPHPAR